MFKIAIIGGGVAGVTTAIQLGSLNLEVTLFEKESSLVNGPPFCHLHAGGNLYREISDNQCVKLLKQSIDFAKFYPFVIDYRPTVIALPITDPSSPEKLIPRLELLKREYQKLIDENPNNKILGDSDNYYKLYSKDEVQKLSLLPITENPKTKDEWMIPVAKNLDIESIQFPLIIVNEYGLNLFRLAGGVKIAIDNNPSISLNLNTEVTNITYNKEWSVHYINNGINKEKRFDYIINSAGFRSGKIDDMIGVPCKRMVEFKSAFVTKHQKYSNIKFPEIIFHGERGTPRGMGQFTPYPNGYFQLHGMTNDITLYNDGLVSSTKVSCQPELNKDFIEKIENKWKYEEIEDRSQKAINHLSKFIPDFNQATVGSKPLFGAQQITGDDPTLRVAEVSFPIKYYARCEIVKVSSAIDMVSNIIKVLADLKILKNRQNINFKILENLKEAEIREESKRICREREYPEDLGDRVSDN